MAMNTRNKLTGHMKRTKLVVFVSTVEQFDFHSEDSHTWHHHEKDHHNESSC